MTILFARKSLGIHFRLRGILIYVGLQHDLEAIRYYIYVLYTNFSQYRENKLGLYILIILQP